jgi:hypothetical protein
VLKLYFDKSGQEDAAYLALGGVAANDSLWGEIEGDWRSYLSNHNPPAAYMHLVEAVPLRGEVRREKGWDDDKVFGLVNSLLSYLTTLPKHQYCHSTCSVEMAAYRKLQAESYQMYSPADLCVTTCTSGLFDWYLHNYHGSDLEAHYHFDVGEPFEPILKAKWEKELEISERTGDYSFWTHIKHIGLAQMRSTPGLQVADMLAWATNRNLGKLAQRYRDLVIALRSLIPSKWVIWDEKLLREKFRPLIYKPYSSEQF